MTDSLSITGVVATPPRHIVTAEGLAITSFRLASAQRRFNRHSNSWENGETNWYTVSAFRQLAINVSESVHKSDRVVVSGRLRVREWENGERAGTIVELEADAVGHDLTWGSSIFTRSVRMMSGHETGSFSPSDAPVETWAVDVSRRPEPPVAGADDDPDASAGVPVPESVAPATEQAAPGPLVGA